MIMDPLLDRAELDFPCPRCDFANDFTIKQARVRDVIICRGCKCNLQLDDHMNEVRKAERVIRHELKRLSDTLNSIGDIEIQL